MIADHIRTLTFALTDGAVPSNEGRGYVLRRILRRAVRFGRQQLGLTEPFVHRLVPVVVDSMGGAFPELKKSPQHVADLIRDEEIGFSRTLDRGIALFELAAADAIAREYGKRFLPQTVFAGTKAVGFWEGEPSGEVKAFTESATELNFVEKGGTRVTKIRTPFAWSQLRKEGVSAQIPAERAFNLYDTFGFPIDLTRIMAEERGMTVDIVGYEKLMEQARELARAGGKSADSSLTDIPPDAMSKLSQLIKPTDDQPKFSHQPIKSRIMAIWNGDDLGLSPASAFEDEELAIILDRTNFYSEMGGQVGDSGLLASAIGEFDVQSTRAVGGYVLHIGRIRTGKIAVGDMVDATVSFARQQTEMNHTGTHLANWALRETLGDGVQQKGSLVDPEKLRFDFSHPKAMSDDEIASVEELVNEAIAKKLPVYAQEAPQEKALKINGLRAVFGEKYPPIVRVVSIGAPVAELLKDATNDIWRRFSIEFCGGTHVRSTDEIRRFYITGEESVSKGIRRIIGVTGIYASDAFAADQCIDLLVGDPAKDDEIELKRLQEALLQFSIVPLLAKRRAQKAIAELQVRQRAIEKAAKAQSSGSGVDAVKAAGELLAAAPSLGAGKLVVGQIAGATEDQLRSAIDSLRKKSPTHAILLAASDDQKVTFIAAVSDDLVAKGLKAGDWVKQVAAIAGGGGAVVRRWLRAVGRIRRRLRLRLMSPVRSQRNSKFEI